MFTFKLERLKANTITIYLQFTGIIDKDNFVNAPLHRYRTIAIFGENKIIAYRFKLSQFIKVNFGMEKHDTINLSR